MDESAGVLTPDLTIGEEGYVVSVPKVLGPYSRSRVGRAYGKVAYTTYDPGKEAIAGQVATPRRIKEDPKVMMKPLEELYKLTLEVFEGFPLREKLVIGKSANSWQ
jgi:hypothetical protein